MPDIRQIVRVNPNTLHSELESGGVLLQVETGQYYGLDAVAERFWELIVEYGDLDRVERALLQEYCVDAAVLANDLRIMVNDLIEKQILDTGIGDTGSPGRDSDDVGRETTQR
ncbi:MAG: PqqD family protein [Hyphomicrobiales bacterium]|nr:PqqD family protein [Hyphomicrobiales bacterium]